MLLAMVTCVITIVGCNLAALLFGVQLRSGSNCTAACRPNQSLVWPAHRAVSLALTYVSMFAFANDSKFKVVQWKVQRHRVVCKDACCLRISLPWPYVLDG
eukprot:GHUV01020536.1.p3 GENE.GHUV01020536.1~~GHUV01020536.1.p3  ORF type:complete len:101 (-),score=3.54 GHUV01020536.1:521-823(-)